MTLERGRRIGPYQVLAPLGAGGMGEVWRATDTRLGRDVALKLLPAAFASDPDRLARFEREAKLLASLSHTHIAGLFALEEATLDGGATPMRFLAMELAEGEDLAARLKRGAIPVDESLAIAKQVAEALEAAHEKGIVHRDLKPANVKVSADGHVKVLDFGLAKAWSGDGVGATESADGSRSPTLARTGTAAGLILGTAAYMSPEQARGKPVDKRADVWSFGVLLFEMLSGKRLFDGETVSDTLAAVLRQEVDWNLLPAPLPPSVRQLMRRCLQRDPKQRLRDIGEARIALEAREEATPAAAVNAAAPWRRALPWVAGIALGAAAASSLMAPWRAAPRPAPVRVSAELGAEVSLFTRTGTAVTLAPDGSVLAFMATKNASGPRQLYVRRLDELAASPLSGTDDALNPFFSPDGQWIAFFAGGKLKKVSVTGGAAVTLADAQVGGGAWAEDGTIVFSAGTQGSYGLHRVSSAGGTPEPLATLDAGVRAFWPQVLPGGQSLLYTTNLTMNAFENANVEVQRLPNGPRKVVVQGGYQGRYVASGHLVYIHEGTLFAAPFDLERLELRGSPAPVLEGVTSNPLRGGAQFAFSGNGTLAYLPGESVTFDPIHWMDREGRTTPLRATPANWGDIRFSPDGRRLAMTISDGKQADVWVYESALDSLTRLTFDAAFERRGVWTPDGRRIAFSSSRGSPATYDLCWQRADGTGEPERLLESPYHLAVASWHPSGKFLAFFANNPETGWDLMLLPMDGDEASGWKPGKPSVFLRSSFGEWEPMFSPDGRWLAYHSNESGRPEVYVRPFQGPGGKVRVSTDGGAIATATWSRTRPELFYGTTDGRIMVVPYSAMGDSFLAEKPRLWSEGRFKGRVPYRPFDLHPDGQRFALAPAGETQDEARHVVLVFAFFDELRRLAPVGKP